MRLLLRKDHIRVLVLFFWCCMLSAQKLYHQDTILMGSKFRFSVWAEDSISANKFLNAGINEVIRIEYEISDWIPDTAVSKINTLAGKKAVQVSTEVFHLFERALDYSRWSGGLFDITYAGMERIWKFDGSMENMPTPKQIQNSLKNVGYAQLILDPINQTIFLQKQGAKVSFGSIGKSYAAEMAAQAMQSTGAKNGMVDASGDVKTWGQPSPKEKFWRIGVQNPFYPNQIIEVKKLRDEAVVTSGDYEKFALINGKRYGHIINPKNGMPAQGIVSVTVQGPNAEVANFLSTTCMLMSPKDISVWMKKLPIPKGYQILLITEKGKLYRYRN